MAEKAIVRRRGVLLSPGALGMWDDCLLDMKQCMLLEPQNQSLRRRILDLMSFTDDSHDMPDLLPASTVHEALLEVEPVRSQLL